MNQQHGSNRHRVPLWTAIVVASWLGGCASLPSLEGRPDTFALTDTASTRLGRAIAPDAAAHPGKTGIYALSLPRDAFAARVALASAAEKSIDAQYYIWHGDHVGYLLFEALWRAAGRGVRVRILLDDVNTSGLDETIAAMASHPNIDLRLYNPLAQRDVRAMNFLTDFARVNRRMHNKSFTVDNQAAIVGGRNIGDEYFAAGDETPFVDLDVIAVGSAVHDISRAFDLYWNSPSAYPAARLVGSAGPSAAAWLEGKFAAVHADPESIAYLVDVRETPLLDKLYAGKLTLEWTQAKLVRDDPAKTLDTTERTDVLLLTRLLEIVGAPQSSFELISPYFVPGEEGTEVFRQLAQRGVDVRVLTNSLSSTDVVSVHAGYAKRRCDLVRAGVILYELKPTRSADERPHTGKGSSSSQGLHAKTFAVDRRRIFVGSFNFDQRSKWLNTEMGLVIDSPVLAQRLSKAFDTDVPKTAYEVRASAGADCLEWIDRTPSGEVRYDVDPGSGWLQRSWIQFLGILPIEWLL